MTVLEQIQQIPYLLPALIVILPAYLMGSIPFGLILTRLAGLGDIRQIGSGNIGATNVLRTGKRGLAALTLLLDGGKAYLVVALAVQYFDQWPVWTATLCVVLGHLFPIWLKFRGGKGVATALGAALALDPLLGLCLLMTWLLVALVFRYSSLAALSAFLAAPLYAWCLGRQDLLLVLAVLALLIISRHKENIERLLSGQESKINLGKKPDAPPAAE